MTQRNPPDLHRTRVAVPDGEWARKTKAWLDRHEWTILALLWALAGILGYVGFARHFSLAGEQRTPWDIFYLTVQLFTIESGSQQGFITWELELARLLAPAVTAYTAAATLALVFHEHLQTVRVRFLRNHVIICGLGRRGLLLASGFIDQGFRVAVIERSRDDEFIAQCRDYGAYVLFGNASDRDTLERAGLLRAKHLITVCGEDGTNAEIVASARDLVVSEKGPPITCVAEIDDFDLCRLLKGQEIALGRSDRFRLEFFNGFVSGAAAMLEEYPPFDESVTEEPHILVVGLGRFGESLVVQAARIWRKGPGSDGRLFRLTAVDRQAREKLRLLHFNHSALSRSFKAEALDMDTGSAQFAEGRFLFDAQGKPTLTAAYVLLDNDSRSLSAGLAILKQIRGGSARVVVRMSHEGGLAALIRRADGGAGGFAALQAFGTLERTCRPELVLGGVHETLARLLHQEGLFEGMPSAGDLESPEEVDWSRVPWANLPEHARDLYRRRADCLGTMFHAIGLSIEPASGRDGALLEFTEPEIETAAKIAHTFRSEECARGASARNCGQPDWNLISQAAKASFRQFARSLPHTLAQADIRVFRL